MNYTTSKDYERLWNLVQEGKEIVCFLEGLSTYVTIAKKNGEYSDILSAGVLGAMTKIDFINQCENIYLEFLPPDAWIKIESDKDLPPKGDYCVLVYRQKDNDYEIVHVNYFYSPYVAQKKFYQVTGVTHYKPMPEAPEVQS